MARQIARAHRNLSLFRFDRHSVDVRRRRMVSRQRPDGDARRHRCLAAPQGGHRDPDSLPSTGKAEEDQSSIGLYFADKPPTKHLVDIGLSSRHIDIPAGETNYKVHDHFTIPVDVDAVGIIPHAHYICRKVEGWAILPDGKRISLLRIDDWDFNWQDQYRYTQPTAPPRRHAHRDGADLR